MTEIKKIQTSRSFRKIKINDKKVEVHYTKHVMLEEGIKNIQYPLESEIRPHVDFFAAFQALKKYAIPYMELSTFKNKVDEKTLDAHVVTTLSIKEEPDTVKIQVSMNKFLTSGKCYSVTSPLIDLYNDDFSEIKNLNEAYELLIVEAQEYINGKNGENQLSIIFDAA